MKSFMSFFTKKPKSIMRTSKKTNKTTRFSDVVRTQVQVPTRRSMKYKYIESSNQLKLPTKLRTSPHYKFMRSSSNAQTYFLANKNRNCFENDLDQCIDQTITFIGAPTIIGAGTFGVLLKFMSNKGDIAMKFIFNISDPEERSSGDFINMEKELAFSYHMGNIGIGPEVLDSFYYNFDYAEKEKYPIISEIIGQVSGAFKGDYKQFRYIKDQLRRGNQNVPIEIQCIVMTAYEMDCSSALYDMSVDSDTKIDIVKQMTSLIDTQLRSGLFCSDIKTSNFVVNGVKNRTNLDVRMIDFGVDFCTEGPIFRGINNDDIDDFIGVTYIEILYISNVIQLCMTFYNEVERVMDKYDLSEILPAFLDHDLFDKFFEGRWVEFINWYIDRAFDNFHDNIVEPCNTLYWYTNGSAKYTYAEICGTKRKIINLLKNAV
jgi:hypothetical protein